MVHQGVQRQLYSLFYVQDSLEGSSSFFTLKFHCLPQLYSGYRDGKPLYWQVFLPFLQFGKYKSKDINDWQWTAELNPITNEALNRWLMKLPRKFPLDHTRFKYICLDFNKIPVLYQESVLRLADLGIIQPEANVNPDVFKKKFRPFSDGKGNINRPPELDPPDIRFNAGKLLTRFDAIDIITKVFDESKRVVFDELTFKNDTIDDYGYNYGLVKRYAEIYKEYIELESMGVYSVLYYHTGKTITFRIDELWQLQYVKHNLTQKENIANGNIGEPVSIVFNRRYGAIGNFVYQLALYDGIY